MNCWVKGKDSALNTMLSSPLGVTTVLAALFRATTAAKRGITLLFSPLGVTTVLAALFRATTAAKRGKLCFQVLWE